MTRQRLPSFHDRALANACLGTLDSRVTRFSTKLHAYCLMPDHAHLLLEVPEGISLEQVIHHFKTLSGHVQKGLTGDSAWQISYYDHVLRREEALPDVADYI